MFLRLQLLALSFVAVLPFSATAGVFDAYVGTYSGTKVENTAYGTFSYPLTITVSKSATSSRGRFRGMVITGYTRFNANGTLSGSGRAGSTTFTISGTYRRTAQGIAGTQTVQYSNGGSETGNFTAQVKNGDTLVTRAYGQLSDGTTAASRFVGRQ